MRINPFSHRVNLTAICAAFVFGVGLFSLTRGLPQSSETTAFRAPAVHPKQRLPPDTITTITESGDHFLVVEARGRKFHWHFRYAGADQRFGTIDDVRVGDELHLPLDSDVELRLRSDDYVYIWNSSGLQTREIAVPNLEFVLKFRTQACGEYKLLSDALCGYRILHDELMGRLIIQPRPQFLDWIERTRTQ